MKFQGLHQLNDLIFNLNKPLIGKRGVHYHKLVKDWSKVVGQEISSYTIPIKITSQKHKNSSNNILYLATNNSALAAELVYHLEVIKEQINCYFGYIYIKQIKLLQAVFKGEKKSLEVTLKLSEEEKKRLEKITSFYNQDDLVKNALKTLATLIIKQKN